MKAEFYRRIRKAVVANGDEARLRDTIARLRQRIAAKSKELTRLRAGVPALVRIVHQLTVETSSSAACTTGSVVPFPSREPARPSGRQPVRPALDHLQRTRSLRRGRATSLQWQSDWNGSVRHLRRIG
jgi:hypothetical protein